MIEAGAGCGKVSGQEPVAVKKHPVEPAFVPRCLVVAQSSGVGTSHWPPVTGHCLPPVALYPHVPAVARRPISWNPDSVGSGRYHIPAGHPDIPALMPAVISTRPDVTRTGTHWDDFVYRNRWPIPGDLRSCGPNRQKQSEDARKQSFAHNPPPINFCT